MMSDTNYTPPTSLPQYKAALQANMGRLEALLSDVSSSPYPNLSKLLHAHGGSLGSKLYNLLHYCIHYGEQGMEQITAEHPTRGIEMMASLDTLVRAYGSDKETWRTSLLRLCALGLLYQFKPKTSEDYNQYNTPAQQYSANRATSMSRHPCTWYHFPKYTDKVLEKAEKEAPKVRKLGTGIDKDALRDLYGNTRANRITDTGFSMLEAVAERRQALSDALQSLISATGYTTAEQVKNTVYGQFNDPKRHSMKRIGDSWRSYKPTLFDSLGLKESRPTNAEKQRYGLEDDSYIIRPIAGSE